MGPMLHTNHQNRNVMCSSSLCVVCVCECVAHAHACTCRGESKHQASSFIALYVIFTRQSLSLDQKLAISARLASKLLLLQSLLPNDGLTHTAFLWGCWGFRFRSSYHFLSPVIAVSCQAFFWPIQGLSQRCQASVEEATPTWGHCSSSVYSLGG